MLFKNLQKIIFLIITVVSFQSIYTIIFFLFLNLESGSINAHDLRDPENGGCYAGTSTLIPNGTPGECDEETEIHNTQREQRCEWSGNRSEACLNYDTLENHRECKDCDFSGGGGRNSMDLSGVNASGAKFNGPGQEWVNMNFSDAQLQKANFTGGQFKRGDTKQIINSFEDADLTDASFSGTKWYDDAVNFDGAILKNTNFSGGYFFEAPDFSKAKTLEGAQFINHVVDWETFKILKAKGANLAGIKLRQSAEAIVVQEYAKYQYKDTPSLIFKDIDEKELRGVDFTGVDLTGSNFDSIDFKDLNIVVNIIAGASFNQAKLNQAVYDVFSRGADLSGTVLDGLQLKSDKNFNYKGATITNSNFVSSGTFIADDSTIMENITIDPTRGKRRSVDPYLFQRVVQSNPQTSLSSEPLYGWINFPEGSTFENMDLSNTYLEYVDFFHVTLQEVSFNNAKMEKSNIKCSSLDKVDLTGLETVNTTIKFINWCETKGQDGNERTGGCDVGLPSGPSCQ